MSKDESKTLRLLFPQWQGGNNPAYLFGAQLLNWLAPHADGPIEQVDVEQPTGEPLILEDGIVGRRAVFQQAVNARQLIEKHNPDRLVVLGGDCGVDLAPFAYLSERYDDLAVLWLDTHPDIMVKEVYPHSHAHVMGSLMGQGDQHMASLVKRPVKPENTFFAGRLDTDESLAAVLAMETEFFQRFKLQSASPEELAETSQPVLDWIASIASKHIAIHFDLDVLDAALFRSLLFSNPDPAVPKIVGSPAGRMKADQVVRLLNDVAKKIDIVGLGVTEHLPWDALALKNMLTNLPLVGSKQT
jgi:arginase